jgi:hypothetical protein
VSVVCPPCRQADPDHDACYFIAEVDPERNPVLCACFDSDHTLIKKWERGICKTCGHTDWEHSEDDKPDRFSDRCHAQGCHCRKYT